MNTQNTEGEIQHDTINYSITQNTVTFKAIYWSEEEDETLIIHVRGNTIDHKSVYVKIINFKPYIYIAIPPRINNMAKCKAFVYSKIFNHFEPQSFQPIQKDNLYGKVSTNLLCITFKTNKTCKAFANKCRKGGFSIDGLGYFKFGELSVHEDNVDPIIKFTSQHELNMAGWLTVNECIIKSDMGLSQDERKFSECDIDMYCHHELIHNASTNTYPNSKSCPIKYISFDLETYSQNHNSKNPDPEELYNRVFQIGFVVGYIGDKNYDRHLLTLFHARNIKDTHVYSYESERDMLLAFRDMIMLEKPDIFIGYNIMKFDWNYLVVRSGIVGIINKFCKISYLSNNLALVKEKNWSSSAYGQQKFKYVDIKGMVHVDVLIEIERNYKLPSYKLEKVAEHFLGEHKDPVTHYEIFMVYKLNDEIYKKYTYLQEFSKNEIIDVHKMCKNILQLRKTHNNLRILRKKFLNLQTSKGLWKCLDRMVEIIGKYCVQDCILPIRLVEKLQLMVSMASTSNIMCVPMSYLHTRGQQIKVLAQLYRKVLEHQLFIPFIPKNKEYDHYEGATVIDAIPGNYDYVASHDFESLYPSIIITYNICYTTFKDENDPIPDNECNILTWESHIKCQHDPQKRKCKKDKSDIVCGTFRYRFLKVKVNSDGTRENEGIFPLILRNLLAERKAVKATKAKLEAELIQHLGKASEKDIASYKKKGYSIIEKGSLSKEREDELNVLVSVYDADQSAIKVSANSMYGCYGAKSGFIPFIEGAASVTAMGRKSILSTIQYIIKTYNNSKLVYGDTDSCMICFDTQNAKDTFELSRNACKKSTHFLRSELLGVSENYMVMCGDKQKTLNDINSDDIKYLSDSDKILKLTYDGYALNLAVDNIYSRFVLLSKKRYCAYSVNEDDKILKTIKKGVVLARRDNCQYLRTTYQQIIQAILNKESEECVMNILYDRVNMLFTRQIDDLDFIIYTGVKDLLSYAQKNKQDQYTDINGEVISNVVGPLDPRLVYLNRPQILLCKKMTKRGDEIPPNTRLEYIYLCMDNWEHQGDKAEDYTYYTENKIQQNLHIDYLHYIEKQLCKPISELLKVIYQHEQVLYEKPEDEFVSLLNRLRDNEKYGIKMAGIKYTSNNITENQLHKLVNYIIKNYKDDTNTNHNIDIQELNIENDKDEIQDLTEHLTSLTSLTHLSPNTNNDNKFKISLKYHKRLVYLSKLLHSKYIMNKLYKQFGLNKRKAYIKPFNRKCNYYYRDSHIMDDVLMYRTYYNEVIKELPIVYNQVVEKLKTPD